MRSIFLKNLLWLKKSFKTLLLFELLYKIVAAAIVLPLIAYIFQGILSLSGYAYLTNENFIAFATKPVNIILVVMASFGFAFYVLVEEASLVFLFHACHKNEKITTWQMLVQGIKRSLGILKPKWCNLLFVVYLLLMVPFVNILALSSVPNSIKMPGFAMDVIHRSTFFTLLFCAGFFFLVIKLIIWFFSIHFFTLEKVDFKVARQKSRKLMKGRFSRTILIMVLGNVLLMAVIVILYVLVIGLFYLIFWLSGGSGGALSAMLSVIGNFNTGIFAITSGLSVPFNFTIISVLYYKYLEEDGIVIAPVETTVPPLLPKIRRRTLAGLISLAVLLTGSFLYGVTRDMVFNNVEILHHTDITCHRGYSQEAPENTLESLQAAMNVGADFAEIDVQQTKDQEVVLLHDSSIKRITGVDKDIWEADYDEIEKLDAGSWFDPRFSDVRIPTLDEAVKQFRWLLRLNIEIKPNGHETGLVKSVVDIIDNNYAVDSCLISSLDSEVLKEVKQLNPRIKTAYVMSVAYGDVTDLDFADILCVEITFLTEDLVEEAHSNGKDVYVWTANSRESIQKALSYKVDNIITDDPLLAKEMITDYNSNPIFVRSLQFLLNFKW